MFARLKHPGSEPFRDPPKGIRNKQLSLGRAAKCTEAMKDDRYNSFYIKRERTFTSDLYMIG